MDTPQDVLSLCLLSLAYGPIEISKSCVAVRIRSCFLLVMDIPPMVPEFVQEVEEHHSAYHQKVKRKVREVRPHLH